MGRVGRATARAVSACWNRFGAGDVAGGTGEQSAAVERTEGSGVREWRRREAEKPVCRVRRERPRPRPPWRCRAGLAASPTGKGNVGVRAPAVRRRSAPAAERTRVATWRTGERRRLRASQLGRSPERVSVAGIVAAGRPGEAGGAGAVDFVRLPLGSARHGCPEKWR
jgi:hypothetical protein